MPLEKQWQPSKLETFRIWILYSIKYENLKTRDELISSPERTFKPEYVPILSEFRFSLGKGFDFREFFNVLVEPLLSQSLLIQQKDEFEITAEGANFVKRIVKNSRFR